jgi:hypothetical protein
MTRPRPTKTTTTTTTTAPATPEPSVEELVALGLEQVKATGRAPCLVAATLLAERRPGAGVRARLAAVGLAKLVDDALARLRRQEVEACARELDRVEAGLQELRERDPVFRAEQQREEDWQRQQPERHERRDRYHAGHDERAFVDDIDRIHRALHCPHTSHRGHAAKRACVGDLVYVEDKKAQRAEIARRRRDNDRYTARTQKLGREHHEQMKEVFQFFHDRTYQAAVKDLESIILVTVDGTMKPLTQFTQADADKWCRDAGAQASAWARRRTFFQGLAATLAKAGVDCVGQLPVADVKRLAAAARAVWKGQGADGADAAQEAR